MLYALRHSEKVTKLKPYLTLDHGLSFLLFLAGLYAYTATLAPTVLEGDGALFQYTPYVLGVTYPTGFPLYILLGKVWLTIFPFGEIAWRMNLLSALCSALTLPLLYNAARRFFALSLNRGNKNLSPHPNPLPQERPLLQEREHLSPPLPKKSGHPGSSLPKKRKRLDPPPPQKSKRLGPPRWAALAATLTYATLPTFWLWSTGTKTYALNILLLSLSLYLIARAMKKEQQNGPALTAPLYWPALLLGLQISVHNTAILVAPGLLLLAWLYLGRYLRRPRAWLVHLGLMAAPGLFYLYIPLRAQWLIGQYGRIGAIERGLLADFYQPGWAGLVRYYTAADFTGGVVTNWGAVPGQFFSRYLPILIDNFTGWGVILGLVGGPLWPCGNSAFLSPYF